MSRTMTLAWYQFRLERRMFWRNPTAAFFSIVLPLVFLALFGAIASGDQAALDQLVPGIAAMSIASNTFSALTMQITILRDQGVLKRIRGTALPTRAYLAAVIGSAVLNAFAQVAVVVVAGKLFFGLDWPPHPVELVAVVDVVAGKVIRWTGKSYPTSSQEQDLVQVTDLRSHLLELAGERVLVLGCHDLNMWSPRSRANQAQGSRRNIRCTSMIELAAKFKPTIVLQHPHTTDTVRIWSVAWSGIRQSLPSVAHYASGIAYYNRDGACRGRIEAVQSGTKFGNVIDRVLKT